MRLFIAALLLIYIFQTRGLVTALLASVGAELLNKLSVLRHLGGSEADKLSILTLMLPFPLAIGLWGYIGDRVLGRLRPIETR